MTENKPLREAIREIIDEANCRHDSQTWGQFKDYIADETIEYFKILVNGLQVIGDEERMEVWIPCETCDKKPEFPTAACMDCAARQHIQAQLAHDIKELKTKCGMG